jgi:hypothetical protein
MTSGVMLAVVAAYFAALFAVARRRSRPGQTQADRGATPA